MDLCVTPIYVFSPLLMVFSEKNINLAYHEEIHESAPCDVVGSRYSSLCVWTQLINEFFNNKAKN